MASKPKSRTFIVHHRGRTYLKNPRGGTYYGGYMVLGRYKVGARNKKEAESLLREVVGKHAKVKVYYEDLKAFMPHGIVVREC